MYPRSFLLLALLVLTGAVLWFAASTLDRPVAVAAASFAADPFSGQPANPALRQLGAATSAFTNPAPISIPSAGAASPYPSTINVTGLSSGITKLVVKLFGVNHTYPRDVDIKLVAPDGRRILLMSDAGAAQGGTALVNATLTFDDNAPLLPCAASFGSGGYRPTNCQDNEGDDVFPAPAPTGVTGDSLAHFAGLNPNGVWSLYVRDDAATDQGVIQGGWELDIEAGGCAGPVVFRGQVQLQARTNYSGVQVGPANSAPLVTTGPDGTFQFTVNSPGTYTIRAARSKYLPAVMTVANACGTVTLPTVKLLGGDTDGDGVVGIADLVRLGLNYGTNPASDPRADIDENGRVDIADLTMVGSNYGLTETPWP